MEPWIWIPIIVILALAVIFFVTLLVCFRMCFYSAPRRVLGEGEYEFPEGGIYIPIRERMVAWLEQVPLLLFMRFKSASQTAACFPYSDCFISSFDPLALF